MHDRIPRCTVSVTMHKQGVLQGAILTWVLLFLLSFFVLHSPYSWTFSYPFGSGTTAHHSRKRTRPSSGRRVGRRRSGGRRTIPKEEREKDWWPRSRYTNHQVMCGVILSHGVRGRPTPRALSLSLASPAPSPRFSSSYPLLLLHLCEVL